MALARLKSIEALRYCAPGQWGKLLGLDRIPEVRTLRAKIRPLAALKQAVPWSAELCTQWMAAAPESAAVLYIDGHVRIYHGHQRPLPKHYVARERLCLRATIDYWVNALDGQPFFVVNPGVDPGLLRVLGNEILPRLEKEVPAQPSAEQLAADPWRHRFTLVFDREGDSPAFFLRMKQKHIACLTYHKYPGAQWPEEEFLPCQVELSSGERVEMQRAERGTFLGEKVWVREIGKLTHSGHQSACLSSDYRSELAPLACAMFARWCEAKLLQVYARTLPSRWISGLLYRGRS